MRWFDFLLLDRVYQPIVDALYERIGDSATIARLVMSHALGLTVCLMIWYILTTGGTLVVILAQLFMIFGIMSSIAGFRSHVGKTGPNPLRFFMFLPRMLVLFWAIGDITVNVLNLPDDIVGSSGEIIRDVMVVSGFYFVSCYNRPPMKRQRVQRPKFA